MYPLMFVINILKLQGNIFFNGNRASAFALQNRNDVARFRAGATKRAQLAGDSRQRDLFLIGVMPRPSPHAWLSGHRPAVPYSAGVGACDGLFRVPNSRTEPSRSI